LDFSNAQTVHKTWYNCSELVRIPKLNFKHITGGTDTFKGCKKLNDPTESGTPVRNGDDAIAGTWEYVVMDMFISTTFETLNPTSTKPTISGKLGFTYDGGNGSKWVHDGTDWVEWGQGSSSGSMLSSKDRLRLDALETDEDLDRMYINKNTIYLGRGTDGTSVISHSKVGETSAFGGTGKTQPWFVGMFPKAPTHQDDLAIVNYDGGIIFKPKDGSEIRIYNQDDSDYKVVATKEDIDHILDNYDVISGHEDVTGKVGYYPSGIDRTGYLKIGERSLDLSDGDGNMEDKGISGECSFGIGYNIRGKGYASIIGGYDNIVDGHYSIVNGISNTTCGGGVLVVGVGLDACGGDNGLVLGQCNVKPDGNPYTLQVGNGTVRKVADADLKPGVRAYERLVPSDSFRVYKDGLVEAPSMDIPMIESGSLNVLTTKEYVIDKLKTTQVTDVTYDELKTLRDDKKLIAGNQYKITDFKTIYQQPESNIVNTSTEGVADGLDTEVEELILTAVTEDKFDQYVTSPKYPQDIIKYHIDLDLTGGTAPHKGGIFYREDSIINVKTTYDWRTIKYRRYALTAPGWDDKKDYKKGDPCRVGDRLFLALKDHTNKEPVANDAKYWMTVFHDLKSRPDLEYNTAKKVRGTGDNLMRTFGFDVDATKYKDYYTFAFLDEPDNSSGIHKGLGKSISGISLLPDFRVDGNGIPIYYSVIPNNVIMIEHDVFKEADAFTEISLTGITYFYWNTIRPYWAGAQINFKNVYTFSNCYLTGNVFGLYFENVPNVNNSFIRGFSKVRTHRLGINNSVINQQGDDLDASSYFAKNNVSIFNSYIYQKNTIVGVDEFVVEEVVMAGTVGARFSNAIKLYNGEIYGSINGTSIYTESGAHRIGNGYNNGLVINGDVTNSVLIDVVDTTIDGNLNGVELRQCKDVTIPSNVTLNEVKFDIPLWKGKNIWPTEPYKLEYVKVSRKWIDDSQNPTHEKLWYEQIDEDGIIQLIEIK